MITVVLGMPRTGTSMLMQMLKAGGMEVVDDEKSKPDIDNPKGYIEYDGVKDIGKNPNMALEWEGKAIKVISQWFLALPLMLHKDDTHYFMKYSVLFTSRDMKEIIESQCLMLQHRWGYYAQVLRRAAMHDEGRDVILQYEDHLQHLRFYLSTHTDNFRTMHVDYRDAVNSPTQTALRIHDFLKEFHPNLNLSKMSESVDKKLWRNRNDFSSNRK